MTDDYAGANDMGLSTEGAKNCERVVEISGFADDSMIECDKSVCCQHDSVWMRPRNGQSFANCVPQSELANGQSTNLTLPDSRSNTLEVITSLREQFAATWGSGGQNEEPGPRSIIDPTAFFQIDGQVSHRRETD
jgi:hypothetical protein